MKDSSPPVTDKKKPPTARNSYELPREFCPTWPKACSETVSVFTDETEHRLSPRLRADHRPYRRIRKRWSPIQIAHLRAPLPVNKNQGRLRCTAVGSCRRWC